MEGGSSAPIPDAGGTNHIIYFFYAIAVLYRLRLLLCSNRLTPFVIDTMAQDRSRARVPRVQPTAEAVVVARSRVEARHGGSPVRARNEAISSNKRLSSSVSLSLPSSQKHAHTSAAQDGMGLMLLAEAAELRG